jgi:hypothetical protein
MQEAVMAKPYQWVVRGVDQDLARQFVDRAGRQRRATGEVLNEVLRAFLARPEDPIAPVASPGLEGAGDLTAPREQMDLLLAIQHRLALQEEFTLKLSAMTDNINGRVKALETGARSTASPAESPAESKPDRNEAGEVFAIGGNGTRRRLTEAGVAEAVRMIQAGDADADIARRLGVERGAIRQRRKNLDQSAQPQSVERPTEAATSSPAP